MWMSLQSVTFVPSPQTVFRKSCNIQHFWDQRVARHFNFPYIKNITLNMYIS